MTIELNHTIVRATNKKKSAQFYADIFGFEYLGELFDDHFSVVRISDSLTFDFMEAADIASQHYAFKVSEKAFDSIFERVQKQGLAYSSSPDMSEDMKVYRHNGGRGVYFPDPDGHCLEILTADYDGTKRFER